MSTAALRTRERVLDPIEVAVAEIAAGRPIVVVDDEDRENEGDLTIAACHATAATVGLMVRYGSGVICAPMVAADLERLRLPPMTAVNEDPRATAYTVSVDAYHGCTTGISADDRTRTLRVLADPRSGAADLRRPGHVFPLRAVPGGVLVRPGHTEAAVDFARLAGLPSVAAICELVNDNGSVMRLPELVHFARDRQLAIVSIADLILHRLRQQAHLHHTGHIRLPTRHGTFRAIAYRSTLPGDHTEILALLMGEVADGEDVLVHLHHECVIGDVFATSACPCNEQLNAVMARIATAGRGVLLYLRENQRQPRAAPRGGPHCGVSTGDQLTRIRLYGASHQILADLRIRSVHVIGTAGRDLLEELGTRTAVTEPSR
ncbi:3,4-dihydroxy-2-butanone-4-phosphate synthase [Actinophytocola sp.]|uniref:3,4-dihydroxy-2-butanone-4-phosphate synthase n=1 Tax=Actinophytocola sp. TaxID=1872138 RepID=UPI002D7ECED5|nr:3,4-dihydroxy-2-butanone-4-phosphate synthase [Actinophytocola sp.]HET9139447.1 3,4-dihydroxy-2-butanone-4-phosphate synthase [Actinophytocola sp.]